MKWTELKDGCEMPNYDEQVLWLAEDGNCFVDALDKDGNPWLYEHESEGFKFPKVTHWARFTLPDESPSPLSGEEIKPFDSVTTAGELPRPKVVCLCGSTRFAEWFMIKRWELEKQGIITFGINILPDNYFAEGNSHGAEQEGVKDVLDELHKRKIDLSDEVFILNVGGYIGESTRNELNYAIQTGKPVKYLEPLHSEQNVKASVATEVDSSTPDGKQNNSSNSGEQQPVTGELYWKQRCLAAENVIHVFPIKGHYFNTSSKSKEEAYETWQQLKNQEVEPQQNQDE